MGMRGVADHHLTMPKEPNAQVSVKTEQITDTKMSDSGEQSVSPSADMYDQ